MRTTSARRAGRGSEPSASWSPLGLCVAATLAAAALFDATGTTLAPGSLVAATGLVVVPLTIHVIYTWFRPDPVLGPIAGGLTTVIWSGLAAGFLALAALRTRAPLIDTSLAGADAMLGVSAPWLVGVAASCPPLGLVLDFAYVATVPAVFALIVLLGWTRRTTCLWQLCFVFAGSVLTCTLLSALVPAVGTFVHYGIPASQLDRLPVGAGRFHLPVFEAYRSGAVSVVDLRHLDGVVVFPSFHAAMALMTADAARHLPRLRLAAWGWGGVVVASTIPIGGHYVVDVVAGALVWAAFTLLARSRAAALGRRVAQRRGPGTRVPAPSPLPGRRLIQPEAPSGEQGWLSQRRPSPWPGRAI